MSRSLIGLSGRPWCVGQRLAVLARASLLVAILAGVASLASDGGSAQEREEKVKMEKKVKSLVLVINYPYQITGSGKTLIHTVLYKPDFTPAAGATVTVNGKEVGKADENGVCVFEYVPGAGRSHKLVATLDQKGTRYRVSKHFQSNGRTESFRSDQLFVYTDRGVYNPGDNILVRLLAWELLGDYKAIPNAEVSVLLQSQKGKVFAGEKVKTNEFGVAGLTLPLAQNMAEGDYELVVLYQKAREKARLRVERFQPPIIEIKHNLKRFLTPAQEMLEVEASLTYFAGGKPQGASVCLKALDPADKQLFSKLMDLAPGDAVFKTTLDQKELDEIRGKLQAEQPFKIALKATDKFGRSSEVKRDMVFTKRPFRAVLELDKDDYPPGETVKLHAKVVDLDGKPARGIELTCEVSALKVKVTALTDDHGVAEFTFVMGKSGANAVVTSPVMPDPLATVFVNVNTPKPMTSKVSDPPQKQGIQTHFDITFDPDFQPVEKVVHVDFTDLSGGLVVATTIPVSRKGDDHVAYGTVTAPTWGTMLANLYVSAVRKKDVKQGKPLSIHNVGFITEGQHVPLYPDSEATITITGLKPRVNPGEKANIRVQVKTKSGQEAAVGAALVDNAVVSLMDPLEVTPLDHFYNPQRKVISTGGAGVLTWPVVDRNWGSPWRDIAYCNWGFKDPGGMVNEGRGGNGGGEEGGGLGGVGYGSGGGAPDDAPVATAAPAAESKEAPAKLKAQVAKSSVMNMLTAKKGVKYEFSDELVEGELDGVDKADGDLAQAGVERARRKKGGADQPPPPKKITIRTRFPETALWEPLLKTSGGSLDLAVTFPDAITVQRLTLIASDTVGGIGLLHTDVEVRQDLFVQTDVPATLTLGDEVTIAALIQNLSGQDVQVTVQPAASGLEVVGAAARVIAIRNGESAPVEWQVRTSFCGKVEFAVTADGPAFKDEEHRTLFVLPAGNPDVVVERGKVSKGQPFSVKVEMESNASYATAFLNVSFPNVIPALQAWEAGEEIPLAYVGISGLAGRAILEASLLEWGRANRMSEEWLKQLRGRLERAAAELVAAQNKDGSWGWFYLPDASSSRGGYTVSVYLGAYAVKALSAIAHVDLLVDTTALLKGVEYLLSARNKDGLWSAEGAYFWATHSVETDWALSADLFDTVVRAERIVRKAPSDEARKTRALMEKHLQGPNQEPAFVAHAVSGLLRWADWQKEAALRQKAQGQIESLLKLKREGYWEPHWYSAYGGMVELNATILELLKDADDPNYDAVIYELTTFLLSTREAWGSWHNEFGTAAAVSALLAAGAGLVQEIPSTVQVTVNGDVVAAVAIDPKDPFLSAGRLRHLELTRFLSDGKNRVEVAYDGNLSAPVTLELKQWGIPTRGKGRDQGSALRVERSCADRAAVGEPVAVTLTVLSDRTVPHVQVTDSVPSNMDLDTASLQELVKAGKIASFHLQDGSVTLFLDRVEKSATLTYSLIGGRVGRAEHRGAVAAARYHPDVAAGHCAGNALTTSP